MVRHYDQSLKKTNPTEPLMPYAILFLLPEGILCFLKNLIFQLDIKTTYITHFYSKVLFLNSYNPILSFSLPLSIILDQVFSVFLFFSLEQVSKLSQPERLPFEMGSAVCLIWISHASIPN